MSPEKNQKTVLKQVLRRISPHRFLLILTLLLAVVCVVSQLYVPILVGQAVDCVLGPDQVDFQALGSILLTIILAAGGGAWFGICGRRRSGTYRNCRLLI